MYLFYNKITDLTITIKPFFKNHIKSFQTIPHLIPSTALNAVHVVNCPVKILSLEIENGIEIEEDT